MKFNIHSEFEGLHSVLSASQSSWVNYSSEKMDLVYRNRLAATKGTAMHEYAAMAIKLRIKQARSARTINTYINECIGYRMEPEVLLFYSRNAYGTADAIKFDDRKKHLQIFDLKTGSVEAKFRQLYVYAAFFCLEYDHKPSDLTYDFRIYQNDQVFYADQDDPIDAGYIQEIMHKIVEFDQIIDAVRLETL